MLREMWDSRALIQIMLMYNAAICKRAWWLLMKFSRNFLMSNNATSRCLIKLMKNIIGSKTKIKTTHEFAIRIADKSSCGIFEETLLANKRIVSAMYRLCLVLKKATVKTARQRRIQQEDS